jgi:hypothetical protein
MATMDGMLTNLEDNWDKLLNTVATASGIFASAKSSVSGLNSVLGSLNVLLGGGTIAEEIAMAERSLKAFQDRVAEGGAPKWMIDAIAATKTEIGQLQELQRLTLGLKGDVGLPSAGGVTPAPDDNIIEGGISPFSLNNIGLLKANWEETAGLMAETRQLEIDAAIQHALKIQEIDAAVVQDGIDRAEDAAAQKARIKKMELSTAAGFLGALANVSAAFGKKQSTATKRFAQASAIANSWLAATQVLASPHLLYPYNMIAASSVALNGLAMARNIESGSKGGGVGAAASVPIGAGDGNLGQPTATTTNSSQIFLLGGSGISDSEVPGLIDTIRTTLEDTDSQLLPENGADINNIQRL